MKTCVTKMLVLITALFALLACSGTSVTSANKAAQLLRLDYVSSIDNSARQYFVYLPAGYQQNSTKKWPVMLFLHGNGERGNGLDELDYTLIHGPLYEAWVQKRELPFIIVVPQLQMFDMGKLPYIANRSAADIPKRLTDGVPPRPHMFASAKPIAPAAAVNDMSTVPPLLPDGWEKAEQDLLAILQNVQASYNTDASRLYLTGISYGGFGSWFMASKHPQLFAAVAPVVGWGHPDLMPPIANAKTPLWVFAAGRDSAVNKDYFYPGIETLRQLGHSNVRFSMLEQAEHDAWRQVYAGEDLYSWLLQQQKPVTNVAVTVFDQVHVLPMDSNQLLRNQRVLVQDDRIVAVGAAAELAIPQGAKVIDGAGRYLMPGLAEMHGHVPPLADFSGTPARYLDDVLTLYLAGGVTTVRGMLGHDKQLLLKDDIASGKRLGPTLYLAGPSFNQHTVTSAEQARERVRQHKQQGWDLLKIHPGLSLKHYQAIADEAKQQGIDFAGHVPEDVGIEQAILLGSRTIDHLDGYMAALGGFDKELTAADMAPLIALTKTNNVAVVPTQALWETIIGASDASQLQRYDELKYMPARVIAGWQRYVQQPGGAYYSGDTAALHAQNRQRLLRALNDADVTILMGTDAPQLYSVPGLSLRREIPKMAAAGISNYDILRSGTVLVGEYFADKDRFGQVMAGQRADLLLVEGNPLDDLSVLYQPAGVMVRGQWLSRATLDSKLAEIAAARLAENQQ
ncbi:imidazolonepropionase-like amidohydrolase/predicted esterase [Rheinheimera pacifica]|uniref:amidohydrolase family protein n=1 Tax=Rheinheimera pacifica TaxID=173990 RepID=UPI00285E613C|nr:amidohydrolase family protein [Rheinheimera pacifica]MDR6984181.1 imidazolonepropionase-like amidohydrolase/predicted esterase [Rheinheimera pacifica]